MLGSWFKSCGQLAAFLKDRAGVNQLRWSGECPAAELDQPVWALHPQIIFLDTHTTNHVSFELIAESGEALQLRLSVAIDSRRCQRDCKVGDCCAPMETHGHLGAAPAHFFEGGDCKGRRGPRQCAGRRRAEGRRNQRKARGGACGSERSQGTGEQSTHTMCPCHARGRALLAAPSLACYPPVD